MHNKYKEWQHLKIHNFKYMRVTLLKLSTQYIKKISKAYNDRPKKILKSLKSVAPDEQVKINLMETDVFLTSS